MTRDAYYTLLGVLGGVLAEAALLATGNAPVVMDASIALEVICG